ncbi:MAG: proprotein convertase P-domain-containing protein, partial [Anaerolineae bacterium]
MKPTDDTKRWRRISSVVVMLALLLSQWSLPTYPARAADDSLPLVDASPDSVPSVIDYPRVDTGYDVLPMVDTATLETDGNAISAAPNTPSNPTPANGATYVMTTTTVSWSGGDPDGDPVTYTVAFGDSNPPPVVDNVTATTYDPGPLDYNLTYYWQITATDGLNTSVGSLWSFSTASDPENCTLYPSTDTPMPLVDDGVMTSTLTVGDSYIVGDVNVTLNISHTWDYDLEIRLMAPDNSFITLVYRAGGDGDGFFGTMLDDEADIPITSGDAPFTGRFRPAEPFDAFDFRDSDGDWRLIILDYTPGDTGTLDGWQLELCSSTQTNRAPYNPRGPWPSDGATDIPTTLSLSWIGGDPDDDPVTYTVAFGGSSPPPVVDSNVTTTSYNPGPLNYNSTYYWQITATDGM